MRNARVAQYLNLHLEIRASKLKMERPTKKLQTEVFYAYRQNVFKSKLSQKNSFWHMFLLVFFQHNKFY